MTPDAIQLFEGKEIRVMQQKGEAWVRLDDLAAAWGIDRTTPRKIIERNEEVFEGLHLSVAVGDITSPDVWHCVNEQGLYLLMGKVSAGRLKNPEAKSAIIRFQRWVPQLIQKFRKGEIQQGEDNPLAASLLRHADIADILISRFGYEKVIARKLAMEAVVIEQGNKAMLYRGPALLGVPEKKEPDPALAEGPDQDFERYFSLTKVSEMCGCPIEQARTILENEQVLEYSNGIWHLTRFGEGLGKAFTTIPLYPHRMTERKMIRYNPAAIDLIRKHLAGAQATLTKVT